MEPKPQPLDLLRLMHVSDGCHFMPAFLRFYHNGFSRFSAVLFLFIPVTIFVTLQTA